MGNRTSKKDDKDGVNTDGDQQVQQQDNKNSDQNISNVFVDNDTFDERNAIDDDDFFMNNNNDDFEMNDDDCDDMNDNIDLNNDLNANDEDTTSKALTKPKPKPKPTTFKVGDVYRQGKELIIVRYYGPCEIKYSWKKDDDQNFYGIERFRTKTGKRKHTIYGSDKAIDIDDGKCGATEHFKVERPGHGDFIDISDYEVQRKPVLWSIEKSKQALEIQQFEQTVLTSACKYGDIDVVKHMLSFCESNEEKRDALNFKSNKDDEEKKQHKLEQQQKYESSMRYYHTQQQMQMPKKPKLEKSTTSLSPMEYLLYYKQNRILQYVLMQLEKENTQDPQFYSDECLNTLYETGDFETLQLFIKYDNWSEIPANFDPANFNGLYKGIASWGSCTQGHFEIYKMLLKNDPSIINKSMVHPTDSAIDRDYSGISCVNTTILHLCIAGGTDIHFKFIEYLLPLSEKLGIEYQWDEPYTFWTTDGYNKRMPCTYMRMPILYHTLNNYESGSYFTSKTLRLLLKYGDCDPNWYPTTVKLYQLLPFLQKNSTVPMPFDVEKKYGDQYFIYKNTATFHQSSFTLFVEAMNSHYGYCFRDESRYNGGYEDSAEKIETKHTNYLNTLKIMVDFGITLDKQRLIYLGRQNVAWGRKMNIQKWCLHDYTKYPCRGKEFINHFKTNMSQFIIQARNELTDTIKAALDKKDNQLLTLLLQVGIIDFIYTKSDIFKGVKYFEDEKIKEKKVSFKGMKRKRKYDKPEDFFTIFDNDK